MKVTLASLCAALLISSNAFADTTDTAKTSDESVDLMGHAGGVSGGNFGGALLGGSVLARSSVFAGGANLEVSGLFTTRYAAAALGGLSLRHDSGLGLDLLSVVGVHHYVGVGVGFLSRNPGVSGTLPFGGARARLSYQFGHRARRFQLGVTAAHDADLGRSSRSVRYMETDWFFGGEPHEQTSTHTIGFTTTSVMVDVGGAFF